MPSGPREVAKHLRAIGFTVYIPRKNHYRATHPDYEDKPAIHFPATPSDKRWYLNLVSWVRRTYGIDLRETTTKGK